MNKKLLAIFIICIFLISHVEAAKKVKKTKKEKTAKPPKVQIKEQQQTEQLQQEAALKAEAQKKQADEQKAASQQASQEKSAADAAAATLKKTELETLKAQKNEQKLAQKKLKLEQKAQKTEEKKKQAELNQAQKSKQTIDKVEQKRLAKEQKEAAKQALLAQQLASACKPGTFKVLEECKPCSENCESCSNADVCSYCFPGFFRVISNKKLATSCSSTVPQGYLPQLSKFYKLNPEIPRQAKAGGIAVAYSGKTAISNEPTQLPYTLVAGAPTVNGQKVRVDVVPCQHQCNQCAEGHFFDDKNNSCFSATACEFPRTQVEEGGKKICRANDPAVLRGQISVSQKAQKANSTAPPKRLINLKAQVNRDSLVGITYQWSALSGGQDVTARVFNVAKGNLGAKLKADLSGLGETTFKVVVKDSGVQNHEGITLEHVVAAAPAATPAPEATAQPTA